MKTIIVKQICSNTFSKKNALLLRNEISKLLKQEESIILDFEGTSKYTTLFFNFSTGYFIFLLSKEEYDKRISLKGLSPLGKSMYMVSYNNAVIKEEFQWNTD